MKPNSWEAALSCRPKLDVHDYSHTHNFQLKPKIRIIYIVEPEIIKTTAEDFQELVQRLTGKPVERRRSKDKKNKSSSSLVLLPKPATRTDSTDPPVLLETPRMKIEVEEIYEAENQTSFSGFVEELLDDMNEFPLLSFRSSLFNVFGEMPLC